MKDGRQTILVVDDSDEVRELLMLVLERSGYQVDGAASAEIAFEKTKTERPALLVLDIVLPGMDGLELLLKLRSDLKPPIPQVILCSGFDIAEREALRRGAARFLRKPVSPSDLVDAVAAVLSGRAPAAEAMARERQHCDAARRRARESARELMRRIDAAAAPGEPTLDQLAVGQLSALTEYLDLGCGAIAVLRDDQLVVLAASRDSILEVGSDLGRHLPEAYEVLETGSSLVLPDASVRPFTDVSRALGGIRFFVGVPLVADDRVTVGVICFFKAEPHQLDGEDLSTIQLLGRRGSDLLALMAEGRAPDDLPGRHGGGVVVESLFEELLDTELRLLARQGGSMELVVVAVNALEDVGAAIRGAPDRERLIAGALSDGRVAIFKRARDASARPTMATVLEALRARGLCAVGALDLVGAGPSTLNAPHLIHMAERELDRALEGRGGMRRLVIEEQDLPLG